MVTLKGKGGIILLTSPMIGKSSFALWHALQHLLARNETVLVEPEATNDFFKSRLQATKEPKPFVLRAVDHLDLIRPYQPVEPKHHNTNSFRPRNKRRQRMQKQSRKQNRN